MYSNLSIDNMLGHSVGKSDHSNKYGNKQNKHAEFQIKGENYLNSCRLYTNKLPVKNGPVLFTYKLAGQSVGMTLRGVKQLLAIAGEDITVTILWRRDINENTASQTIET